MIMKSEKTARLNLLKYQLLIIYDLYSFVSPQKHG